MAAYSLEEIREAVKTLNQYSQDGKCSDRDYFKGFEAIFELIDSDWTGENIDPNYKEGYEHCMADIADAISDEWGISVWFEKPGCLDPEEE